MRRGCGGRAWRRRRAGGVDVVEDFGGSAVGGGRGRLLILTGAGEARRDDEYDADQQRDEDLPDHIACLACKMRSASDSGERVSTWLGSSGVCAGWSQATEPARNIRASTSWLMMTAQSPWRISLWRRTRRARRE